MYKSGKDISIKIDDVILNYNDFGKGEIPIIFIHGFPFDKSIWDHQLEHLKTAHRAIAYDIRGYGKSTCGEEKLTISLFADDLIKFMDALQIKKAIVCGLSMGGYILLNALNRYANRFAALIFNDTQCVADTPEIREKRFKNIELIENGGMLKYADDSLDKLFHPDSFTTQKEAVFNLKNIILNTDSKVICETLLALSNRTEMCSMLESTTSTPTLIISGREDKVIPLEQSIYLHQNISGSLIQLIEKSSHLPNLEQPLEFNRLTKNFIDGVKLLYAHQKVAI